MQVSLQTVQSWSSGRRRTPSGIITELRALYARIEHAAAESIEVIAADNPTIVELGIAANDHEAQSLGWPCVGAQAASLGIIAARLDTTIHVVPRGSTAATAAAADAHDKARR